MSVKPEDIGKRVQLHTAQGTLHGEGWMYSHSLVPDVSVVTDEGDDIHWRHDMAKVVGPSDPDAMAVALGHREQRSQAVELGTGDDLDVAAGRCCPTCRHDLTPHNVQVWNAGYSVGVRHTREELA